MAAIDLANEEITKKVCGTAAVVVSGIISVWVQGDTVGSWDLNKFTKKVLSVKSNKDPIYSNLCGLEAVLQTGQKDWNVLKILLQQLYQVAANDKEELV